MKLEQREFELLRDMIYEKTGIMFEDRKRIFIQTRLARRLPEVGCDDAREYYRYLRYQDTSGEEWQALIDSVTTNETYFFREFPQLQCFADQALPNITDPKRASGDYTLNIWSAACSTGDEPYTLAIILKACLDDFNKWRIKLDATDIDTNVLASAKRAIYSSRGVKDVPEEYLSQYFKMQLGQYQVVDEIKNMVQLSQVNLMDRQAMRRYRNYNFIFCRNVLIYFNDASRKQVLSSFYDALVPGGYIFLGHSESVGRISAAFEMVRLGEDIAYRKPLSGASAGSKTAGGVLCQTA